ncbi:MAG: lysophospholipid acyltransferase family protein [Sedimentisphaerales bacterium]|nr:lysophospholipid acyltransferase family protein [Sedimentisphaerales bacterium]
MAEEIRKRKRNKRKKTAVEHWVNYVLIRALIFIVSLFPVEMVLKFACFLGRGLWRHYHRGRQRAIDNLRASFPGKDDEWIRKTGKRSFEHLVMLAVDVIFISRLLTRDNWEKYSTYKNAEPLKWIMAEKKPVLFVAAHYSNFEIMSYVLAQAGFDIYSIARPFDNKFLTKYLYGLRQKSNQKIIDKKGATESMEQIIKEGGALCFIADQNAGKKGVFVDFFGRKASTYKSIGLLAIEYNLPIGVGMSWRVDNKFFFNVEIVRQIMPEEWKDKDDPLLWITQEYTRAFEEGIRRDPAQYWWIHRRWKTRPREERQ